jgi:uncharacterized protein involved in exopolysaccharide biosynthesis
MSGPRRLHPERDDPAFAVVRARTDPPVRRAVFQELPRHEPEVESVQVWRFIRTLSRRRWLIITIVFLGISAALVASLLMTPLYRATATIEVQRQEAQIIEGADVAPATVADAEHMATQNALLRSRSLAERTAEILNLPDNERYTDPEAPRAVRLSEATDAVLANLNVAPVARSRVINVSFVSPDAREAADVVNALTDGFIQVNLERKYNTTSYARGFLEERIATTKSALESSERRLVEYAQANGILEFGQGGNTLSTSLNVSSLQAFQAALADAERAKIVAEQRFQEAKTAVSVSEVVNSQTIREFQIERATVNSERENLLKSFQPNYPGVQQAQARLDALDKEIADENARILASLESEFRAAAATEGRLRDRVATLTGDLQDLRNRSIDYNILQREVYTNRAQYEALLQRYKEIAIAGGG